MHMCMTCNYNIHVNIGGETLIGTLVDYITMDAHYVPTHKI